MLKLKKQNNLNKKDQGFNLIELMVVIGIIGVLSAIAIPSYKTYLLKSKAVQGVVVLDVLKKQVMAHYAENGSFPSSISFAGNSAAAEVVTGIDDHQYVIKLQYHIRDDGFLVCVYLKDFSPNDSGYNRICSNSRIFLDGTIKTSCGRWVENNTADIKKEHLPGGCNCNSISDFSC